jgi:Spy/CpxP family protein refolding chaperone
MTFMKGHNHRFRCFGPGVGPYRYAYAAAWSAPEGDREPWYAQRQHRHRSRHGGFGVRRPLRFLSYQLDLDESQRRQIAAVLDAVKTEREQAVVDERKMIADLADQLAREPLSRDALSETLATRVRSTERIQQRLAAALEEIVGALDPDQREEFAYLLRSGAFQL